MIPSCLLGIIQGTIRRISSAYSSSDRFKSRNHSDTAIPKKTVNFHEETAHDIESTSARRSSIDTFTSADYFTDRDRNMVPRSVYNVSTQASIITSHRVLEE